MQVSTFYEKLNKVDGNIYVIEEEIHLTDGAYEAELQHDNINEATFAVFTGPKLTGDRLETYTLSTPSLAPWKRIVRVYADVPVVYLSYETDGDTVEGDDINRSQAAIVETQAALNDEEARALKAEKKLADDLQAEFNRAKAEESRLDGRIDTETGRAQDAEKVLRDDLATEVTRAKGAETILTDNLASEVTRAKGAEKTLTDNLASEVTRAKAAEKSNSDTINTEKSRATSEEDAIRGTINTNKPIWDDKYTRNEVDNKFSALETAIDWKEAVNAYADLAATYPKPEDGWTVNVKDTDYTYRWDGAKWIAISANAIPKATQSVDGLLTKEDKKSYDEAYSKRHTHSNKSTLDKLTEALLANWTAAYTHISDAVKHITAAERTAWNDADSKKHTHGNKSVIDKVTQAMLDKLTGIATGAEVNVQSDWSATDTGSDAYIKNKPASLPASDVSAWAKASTKPSYSWTEIGSKPSSFPPAAHTHTKSQITDMPTKLSQFTNDQGYLTAADVDTSQNHTHANKTVLDKLSQDTLDKVTNGAGNYGTCSTAAAIAAKTVSCAGFVLTAGAEIAVKFTVTNTAASPTLNVNGTGAKAIYYRGYAISAGYLGTGRTYTFRYNGTQYELTGDLNTNTTNTAGATNSSSKLFLIGATSQAANPQTYSHDTAYVGTDGCVYSGGEKVSTTGHNHDSVYMKKGAVTWGDLKGV